MSVRHANVFLKKVEGRGGLTSGSVQRLEFSLGRTGRAKEGQIHPLALDWSVTVSWLCATLATTVYIMTMHQGP